MASGDTTEESANRDKSYDDLPMIWDNKSILLTVGFFAGALLVAWAAFSVFTWLGGNNRMILLSREEAARMVRERGCKCRKARSPSISGIGVPRKEDYLCSCPPSGKIKTKGRRLLKKKIVSTPTPAGKPEKKVPASTPDVSGIKESL
ncbi:uncharacterized protein LOC119459753 [Dermacentor silvarum]|uniref:uncharacterized protein LOC119459753 n=1 Tax=Dermacentor silvarum TaxID=543639 RepID=UPI002100AE7A|nr:uncharacterized protein LOC119459753 [Dermacentor silvarum]